VFKLAADGSRVDGATFRPARADVKSDA